MKSKFQKHFLSIVATAVVTMLFSCKDNYKEVQKIGVSENEPIGIDYNINLKYSDSGRITANLISTKTLDYSNRDFSFREFIDGMTLYIYDKDNKKSTIVADFATLYNDTNLIEMRTNVVITTHDDKILKTDLLFYDQKKEWLYTNYPVSFTTETDIINGKGFDSNSKFTNAEVLEVTGIITLED